MTLTLRTQRILWLTFAFAALTAAALWASQVVGLPNVAQRALVPVSTVWGMHACFVAGLAGLGGLALPLYRFLGRRRCLTALAIVVAGYFACGLAPKTYRIFFDEHIYMQIGQTIAHTGRAEGANYARAEFGQLEMYDAWVNKQPNGLPYLLSWVYRIAGVSTDAAHVLNRLLIGITSMALYLALSLVPWRLPIGAGLAAAGCFMFVPLVPWWGHTVAVEPGAAATTALAFLAACIHAQLRDRESAQGVPASGLFLAATTAFAVYFRPESMLVFPLVALVLWSTDDRFIEDLSAWAALALAVALACPNVLHLWSMHTEDWGATDGRRFAVDFIAKNLHSNGGYFFNSTWFPLSGAMLALAGIGWLLIRNRTAGFALGVWFALSWGTFILFYAGGYHYGASSRYAIVSCAPLAVFMGIGLTSVGGALRRFPVALYGLAAVLVVNWTSAMHFVPTLSREAAEALEDANFVARTAPTLPQGSLVLTPDPCMWLLEGVNATQFFTIEHMVHEEMRELMNQYPGGIYVHWSYWHNAEPSTADYTAKLLAETSAVTVVRFTTQAYKIALLRIDTPEAIARFGGKVPESPTHRIETDIDATVAKARATLGPASPKAAAPSTIVP